MKNIGPLLCGNCQTPGLAKSALDQLSSSITKFSTRAAKLLSNGVHADELELGPFYARAILENSCAAVLGRIDPFRLLYLSEFQAQPEYEHGKRAKTAFSWAGDVIPEDKTQQLWSVENDLPKISRALFSRHLEHLYWKPAIDLMVDFVSSLNPDPVLIDILEIDSTNYIPIVKGRSQQLYSTLSKGVHWEFFATSMIFDEVTIKTCVRDTLELISTLGLISHFIPTAYASMTAADAVAAYVNFRKEIA
jgi:hypothetical protein